MTTTSKKKKKSPEWVNELYLAVRNAPSPSPPSSPFFAAAEDEEKKSTSFFSSERFNDDDEDAEEKGGGEEGASSSSSSSKLSFLSKKNNPADFENAMDGWLEKAINSSICSSSGGIWRTKENVVETLLPFLSAEYESAKREALFLPRFSHHSDTNHPKEDENEDDDEDDDDDEVLLGVQNASFLKEISDAKLRAMYDEFFDARADLLRLNDVQSDLETFLEWLEENRDCSDGKQQRRVGREKIPGLRINALKHTEEGVSRGENVPVEIYLRRRNESLRELRAKQSRALLLCGESVRSKFLAIILEGFRHDANENLLHETFFPRDPPPLKTSSRNNDDDAPKCFNNKIYLTLRAFCSEPTNAAIVERCYKRAHVKSPCARRILRLCAEGCFESEKYEHVANARECDDYSFRTTGDAVTKCKITRGKDKFVCVRWMCRSKFEVNDVARKAFQDVYAEVTALEILRDFENGEKKVKKKKKKKSSVIKIGNRDDEMSISYSFGTLRDYGACEDFLCVATDWVDGVGLNAWRSNLGEYLKKDANEANNDRTLLLAIAKTMLQMVVDMHEKNVVHFDLKLEHFILSTRRQEEEEEEEEVRKKGTQYAITLIDFGECAVYDISDKVKGTSRARGTEIYHAPEMLLIDEVKTHSALFPSGDSSRTTAAACFVDGKKCDCYSLGVALCELFFSNSPNRHAYEQNGFLGLLNVVAGGDDNAENYSKMLRDDILPSDVIRRPPSDGDIANWLLKTLLVRDPHERTSARRAFTMYSDMIN
ncbi:unnamed protein product [Bathycoccus prasinos]|jgi:serine/threonine protein kinase